MLENFGTPYFAVGAAGNWMKVDLGSEGFGSPVVLAAVANEVAKADGDRG